MRVDATPGRPSPRGRRLTASLAPVTPWAAACWGCALGVDAIITARLVYMQTNSGVLAALAGVGDLLVLAAVLGVAVAVLARR